MISLLEDLLWYVRYMAKHGDFRDAIWLVFGGLAAVLLLWLPE
jgi:hypothetical protein